jgi:hypothetical protein
MDPKGFERLNCVILGYFISVEPCYFSEIFESVIHNIIDVYGTRFEYTFTGKKFEIKTKFLNQVSESYPYFRPK